MQSFKLLIFILCLVIHQLPVNLYSQLNVNFNVDFMAKLLPISPYIYGSNQLLSGKENWTVFRLGGNRMTGYNWENNASNAGKDWYHTSDSYMTSVFGIRNENEPGIVAITFHNRSLENSATSIITIQMAGYVARDKKGEVSEAETAPSARWSQVQARKQAGFETEPDLQDDFVYMDEFVNFLVDTYGPADGDEGIFGYCLDNEPALWSYTHPRIHPEKPLCTEITTKTREFASAIKNVDPLAKIFGPCLYGFAAYSDFQGATDWNTVKKGKSYNWFIDYYLDEMKQAEIDSGKRLLDILTVHWYPEAKGDHRITEKDATTEKDNRARVQAPRTLWDSKYTEDSWIGQWGKSHLPLIPKLMASIDKYYPGTKLAFNEIVYGGPNHISGTIAMADVLGIFAKYGVYLASLWPLTSNCDNYTAAYKMYRNYNDKYSTFGDLYAESTTSDYVNSSIYGSATRDDDTVHLIVINKSFDNAIQGNFTLKLNQSVLSGRVWCVDGTSAKIREIEFITNIQNNSFLYTIPAASVCHLVLKISEKVGIEESRKNDFKFRFDVYPNPFNNACRIEYWLPDYSLSQIEIFSLTGRGVKTFCDLPNTSHIIWDGTDFHNELVSSGVYYVTLKADNHIVQTRKIIYLK